MTFPLVLPGHPRRGAARLLAVVRRLHHQLFNAGTLVTFPIYIWGAAQRGIPVQVNALATLVFLIALAVVLTGQLVSSRRRKALEKAPPITVDLMSRS